MTSTHKKILLGNREVFCEIRKHPRAKHLKISVRRDGTVLATIPRFSRKKDALRFIEAKAGFILKNLENRPKDPERYHTQKKQTYQKHKEEARRYITDKVIFWNTYLNFSYNRLAVRDQSTRWGSCSAQKNLNFHYRLFFLPEELADYVVVHELCHLKEMNHSKKFWALVATQIPDFKDKKRALKQYERSL